MTVLDAYRQAVDPQRHRVYASAQFGRVAGSWRRLAELIALRRIGDAGIELRAGGEYVRLVPASPQDASRLKAAMKRYEVRKRRFGPILDAERLPPAAIRFRVERSAGVRPEAEGWRLTNIEGVRVGLFLGDWRAKLGSRCTVDPAGDQVIVDLRDAEDDVALRRLTRRSGELDLDPSFDPSSVARAYTSMGYSSDWRALRHTSSGSIDESAFTVECQKFYAGSVPVVLLDRALARFDTRVYGGAVYAAVKGSFDAGAVTDGVSFCAPEVGDEGDFAQVQAAITGQADAGHYVEATVMGSDFESADLVAAGLWAPSASYHVAILNTDYDAQDVEPDFGTYLAQPLDEDAIHVEITLGEPAGSRLPLLGVG